MIMVWSLIKNAMKDSMGYIDQLIPWKLNLFIGAAASIKLYSSCILSKNVRLLLVIIQWDCKSFRLLNRSDSYEDIYINFIYISSCSTWVLLGLKSGLTDFFRVLFWHFLAVTVCHHWHILVTRLSYIVHLCCSRLFIDYLTLQWHTE